METGNKNIKFTSEEMFRILDEKDVNAMDSFDEFEKEAAEGLAMVKDRDRLKRIHDRIDEELKEKKKKRGLIVWFSAAASLVIVSGLIWLIMPHMSNKDPNVVAAAEKNKNENEPIVNSDAISIGSFLDFKSLLTNSDIILTKLYILLLIINFSKFLI